MKIDEQVVFLYFDPQFLNATCLLLVTSLVLLWGRIYVVERLVFFVILLCLKCNVLLSLRMYLTMGGVDSY